MKREGKKEPETNRANARVAYYRKYRPTNLDEVVGQPQVVDVLKAAAENGSFAHAYLFTGQRGTGKTTVARILAHMINGLDYSDNLASGNVDIIEIDAASNNGVDDVREIRDSVNLAPMACKYKVYIIDEFHMLSKPAFNALLKTIEEPPEYVVFILATTELQKVPATILSRVQRFHFRPLPAELLAKHLRMIADNEKLNVDDDALLLIAERGGGSVRDSITLLDQLSGNEHITTETVNDILGLVSAKEIDKLIDLIASNASPREVISVVRQLTGDGASATALTEQLIKRLELRAIEHPELYRLINDLLEVSKSAMPETKLIAVLVNCALAVTSSDLAPLGHLPHQGEGSTALAALPSTGLLEQNDKHTESLSSSGNEKTENVLQSVASGEAIEDFSWDDLLQQLTDNDCPSTRALMGQCDYRYSSESNTLTLFFGKAFHRKRAKTQAFNSEVLKALSDLYSSQPAIEISDEAAPLDSDVAAVLSVVGGEVTKINGDA